MAEIMVDDAEKKKTVAAAEHDVQQPRARVLSTNASYGPDCITASYDYDFVQSSIQECTGMTIVSPVRRKYVFKTKTRIPRVGVMLVGLGGNNGTTFAAGILANKHNITWNTRTGPITANYWGSLTQCATFSTGTTANADANGAFTETHARLGDMLPMLCPSDIVVGGWDINGENLKNAMARAHVLDYDLQQKLAPYMEKIKPLPGIYFPKFIAANQEERADSVYENHSYYCILKKLRGDIAEFKRKNELETVIVLWTATTERYISVAHDLADTADHLMRFIGGGSPDDEFANFYDDSKTSIAPSTMYAIAAILEGCCFINGSPQNTIVPAVIELAHQHGVFVAGNDFKTGQTKIKSVMAEFLIGAGLHVSSIVSYNHLGNNDGLNLSAPEQFRSKEISKGGVISDILESNRVLYPSPMAYPDHTVVIKYVPAVGDSKRALDEYSSDIFLGGKNTIAMHNTCEDSLLAAPVMYDLIVLCELFTRVQYARCDDVGGVVQPSPSPDKFSKFGTVLSVLSYLLKAPLVPDGTPIINALSRQRSCIENILRALIGLPPNNHMMLEFKIE